MPNSARCSAPTSNDDSGNSFPEPVPESWRTLSESALHKGQIVLLLGGVDAGKTTLARYLCHWGLQEGWTVGLLDADLGQSTVGPPTTVGFKRLRQDLEELREPPDAMVFLGAITPAECRTEVVVAVRRLADFARRRVDLLIVDTSGMVEGPAAYSLKTQKIECLRPHLVVAIQTPQSRPALQELLRPFRRRADIRVLWLEVAPGVGAKSRAYRREYREIRWNDYFRDATLRRLWLRNRTVLGQRLIRFRFPDGPPEDLLVGLLDRYGWTVGLGVLRSSPFGRSYLDLETPLRSFRSIVAVQLSAFRRMEPTEAFSADSAVANESPLPPE